MFMSWKTENFLVVCFSTFTTFLGRLDKMILKNNGNIKDKNSEDFFLKNEVERLALQVSKSS